MSQKKQPDQQINITEKDQTESVGREQAPSAETEESVDEGTYTSEEPEEKAEPLIE
jgi:hypothetical protein